MPAWDGLNIFLNIALVAVLTGLGYTYKNTRRTKYEGDRQKKIHDIYRSIQDNRFQAFLHERSREKERDNPTKAEADLVKVTRILMWWTALLASASLIGAIFAGFTLPAIRGQLDAMEADQRPWVSVQPMVDKPIYFDEWQEKSLSIKLTYVLENTGHSPARNIRISPLVTPHLGNARGMEQDAPQRKLCEGARRLADEDKIGGPTIFPGGKRTDKIGAGAVGVYQTDTPILFTVQGCIDYTYGKDAHGQTAFRLILGKVVNGQWAGLPFVKGAPVETPTNVPGGLTTAQSSDFESAEDPGGGNYAE